MLPLCDAGEAGPVAWVVDHGWHTDIALPADELTGPLAVYRTIFPGARSLMFGFGKRTFITAKAETLSEYVLGPVPGPGAVQITARQAYAGRVTQVPLPQDGAALLSDFLWSSIARSAAGGPRLISEGPFPGSAFYAATHGYDLGYTCNTWTADALQSAGLPVATDVVFASTMLQRVARVSGACRAAR